MSPESTDKAVVPARKRKPTPPPDWLGQSAVLTQIRRSVEARGISAAALAGAIARPVPEVAAILDGTKVPPLAVVEAMLRALRLVPVCVSVDEYAPGVHFRDHVPQGEASAYDRIDVDARGLLEDRVRDMVLQRSRLEEAFSYGLLDDKSYFKQLYHITEQLRHLAVALAKVDATARLFGQTGEDAVRITYGAKKKKR